MGEEAGRTDPVLPPSENAAQLRTVLVVEDEVLVRHVMAVALRERGLKVLEAANAAEALSLLDGGHTIDLLFSDIQMPGALDGVGLAAQMRDRWPRARVILTSGKQPPAAAAEVGLFIPKPYSPEQVVSTIEGLFEASSVTPAPDAKRQGGDVV